VDRITQLRHFSPTERETFAAIRMRACDMAPYLSSSLFRLRPIAAIGLNTFAVDRRWRLYVSPSCFEEWGVAACAGVLLHECGHVLRDHAGRAEDHAVIDHNAWNIAGDAEINDDLLAGGVVLPEGCVRPESYGWKPGDFAENYYDQLPHVPGGGLRIPGSDSGSDGDSGSGGGGDPSQSEGDSCGSGSGGEPCEWELADDEALFDPMSESDAAVARRIAAEEIMSHSKSRGTVPGGWSSWAERELTPPTVPWQRILRGRVRAALSWRIGQVDYSYRRPGRRQVPHVITPTMVSPNPTLAVVADTSGSVSEGELTAMLSEVQGVVKRCGISGRQLRLLCVDAAVQSVVSVRDARRIEVKGRGGTDMRVGISAAEELKPRPDTIIVMTDGFTPWPAAPGPIKTIALITGTDDDAIASAAGQVPEWIATICLPALTSA
jgi:predicted metal-dependent peptidase